MTLSVALLGALVVVIGSVGLFQPGRFRGMFEMMDSQTRFGLAIGIRVAMGALLWWLADELRHSQVMRLLAVIAFFAAVVILVMGRERLDRLINWWLSLNDGLIRVSCIFAAAFGAYLVYVAI